MRDISIVIVNFNSGQFLEACIETVEASDCAYEIIVVDNGSTDASALFLEGKNPSSEFLTLIKNDRNLGFSAAVNQGVTHSSSEHILFINPDCLIFPHTARALREAIAVDHSIGVIGGLIFNFDGSEQPGCRRRELTLTRSVRKTLGLDDSNGTSIDMTYDPLPNNRIPVDAVSGSFFMMRRDIFLEIGGMDERFFLHFEDLDLCKRIRGVGKKVMFVPDISIFHYQGAASPASGSFVSKQKHRSLLVYQRKHNNCMVWVGYFVALIVWAHYLVNIGIKILPIFASRFVASGRGRRDLSRDEFPWVAMSNHFRNRSRLLFYGLLRELNLENYELPKLRKWLIYSFDDQVMFKDQINIRSLKKEYFEKVPSREALRFKSLLLVDNGSLIAEELIALIMKCEIQKVALLQSKLVVRLNGGEMASRHTQINSLHDELILRLAKDDGSRCEVKRFPPCPAGDSESSRAVDLRTNTENCFLWLCE